MAIGRRIALALATLLACSSGEAPAIAPREPGADPVAEPGADPRVATPTPVVAPVLAPAVRAEVTRLHPALTTARFGGITGDDVGQVIAVGAGGTIVRSEDRGVHWTVVPVDTTATLSAAWRAPSGAFFVAGDAGTVLRSTDAGATWTALGTGTKNALAHLAGNGSQIFAGGAAGTIVRSDDGGDTWRAVAMPSLPPLADDRDRGRDRFRGMPRDDILLPPREPTEAEQLRALTFADAAVEGLGSNRTGELWVLVSRLLWVTDDDGASWRAIARAAPPHDHFEHLHVDASGFVITGRNTHPHRPDLFVALGRTPSRVELWQDLSTRLIGPPVIATIPRPGSDRPRVLLAGDGYDVLSSIDGGASWASSEQSAQMQAPYSLAKRALWVAADGEVFAAGDSGALMHSMDQGESWALLDGGAREPLWGGALSADGATIYAALAHAVLRGRDGTWELLSPGTDRRGLVACCTDVVVTPDDAIIVAGEGSVWRGTDDGTRWTKVVDPARGDCCWSLWGDARAIHGIDRDVLRSSFDGGKTWKRTPLGKLLRRDDGNRFDISGLGDELLVVGGQGVILRSPDRGKTWSRQDAGTTEYLYGGFIGRSAAGSVLAIAVGEHGMVLRSVDGKTWSPAATGTTEPWTGVYADATRGEWFITGAAGLMRSRDDGLTWTAVAPEQRSLRHVFGDGRGRVFALGDAGVVLRVEDRP
ncbi:MAG: hypothetical protein IPH07_39875 [Deltaproteobacteria bacterium]|nr:hypothetical protein [Deltaproteobacteria bacterium]MBK8713990.1 hypothetical protein [Deltaproteobacteria bacterium]MBP7291379.1 hypothetical protein [Nannocystaceae bacterium]